MFFCCFAMTTMSSAILVVPGHPAMVHVCLPMFSVVLLRGAVYTKAQPLVTKQRVASSKSSYLSSTLTNLCVALYYILLYCVVLNCIVLLIYCYVNIIQYNATHKFVGVLDNPQKVVISLDLSSSSICWKPMFISSLEKTVLPFSSSRTSSTIGIFIFSLPTRMASLAHLMSTQIRTASLSGSGANTAGLTHVVADRKPSQ